MTNVSRRITLKKNYILALFAGLLFLSFVFVNIGSGLLLGRQKLDLTRRRTLHAFGSQPSDRLRNKFAFVYPFLPVFGRQPGISRPLPIFAGGSPPA